MPILLLISASRVQITAGENLIKYPGELTTPMADLTTSKVIWNSVLSTKEAKFMGIDIKNFYLNTPRPDTNTCAFTLPTCQMMLSRTTVSLDPLERVRRVEPELLDWIAICKMLWTGGRRLRMRVGADLNSTWSIIIPQPEIWCLSRGGIPMFNKWRSEAAWPSLPGMGNQPMD